VKLTRQLNELYLYESKIPKLLPIFLSLKLQGDNSSPVVTAD
jgi:hypothetical protein